MTLPPDIQDRVIDHLWDDRSALKHCALTSRISTPSAYYHLFSMVCVDHYSLDRWKNIVSAGHSRFLQQLRISNPSEKAPVLESLVGVECPLLSRIALAWVFWDVLPEKSRQAFVDLLSRPGIKSVMMFTCKFPSATYFLRPLAMLPNLRAIDAINVMIEDFPTGYGKFASSSLQFVGADTRLMGSIKAGLQGPISKVSVYQPFSTNANHSWMNILACGVRRLVLKTGEPFWPLNSIPSTFALSPPHNQLQTVEFIFQGIAEEPFSFVIFFFENLHAPNLEQIKILITGPTSSELAQSAAALFVRKGAKLGNPKIQLILSQGAGYFITPIPLEGLEEVQRQYIQAFSLVKMGERFVCTIEH